MKIKILLIIGIFLPLTACAQEGYDFEVERDNEIGRSLAMMESAAEYSSRANQGQYEYEIVNAESDAGYSMEDTLICAEEDYQAAAQSYQVTEDITSQADAAAQEAMTNALETSALEGTPNLADEWRYTNLEQLPEPKVKLPPPDKKTQNALGEKLKELLGERTYGSFGAKSGYINGFSMYRISFDTPWAQGGHGESELLFPLRNSMIGITGSLNYRTAKSSDEDPRKLCGLDLQWQTRMSEGSGHMQDSDWIENDVGYIEDQTGAPAPWAWNHPGKDIYSETDTQVNHANIVDVTGTYNFWLTNNIAIAPRVGFRYQKFEFSVLSVNQVGYGPYAPGFYDMSYLDNDHLKWGDYAVKYRLPYFGLGSEMIWNKFSLVTHFDYSCWVNVKDTDRHLYPVNNPTNLIKVSEGHSTGHAYLFGFEGGWQFWPDWKLSVGTSYVKIYAGGSTTQRWYQNGVYVAYTDPITERIVNKYWLTNANIQYVF
ncbi:MAG: omptin family outer membrane protease [Candidatus Omnitrophica bacterium]|nr:omptin family outer membrane protease [Candidatus Omnitrophota bacterium]MDD5654655.1 omptin family outer membrane protease [Candidatus Omnitrophota bacterium]